ncbi:hypothetical protein Dsin_024293 [Dipteronia sinensis]|uniref:Uncharacterized protein n=1 Tax=Dipteronia sinensis TaxID=43782 RepID=A0AAD9ZV25_9ROSI|nr:hypothetical protein Dsin_024293 [Dipteronia sinensis]
MSQKESSNASITYSFLIYLANLPNYKLYIGVDYQDQELLFWKGVDSFHKNTLGLVRSIDLSSNKLSGEILEAITSLVKLISLNLSRNTLTRPIPPKLGQFSSLNSLDLSKNLFTGKIPESNSRERFHHALNYRVLMPRNIWEIPNFVVPLFQINVLKKN